MRPSQFLWPKIEENGASKSCFENQSCFLRTDEMAEQEYLKIEENGASSSRFLRINLAPEQMIWLIMNTTVRIAKEFLISPVGWIGGLS
jgi:hypothetical protein